MALFNTRRTVHPKASFQRFNMDILQYHTKITFQVYKKNLLRFFTSAAFPAHYHSDVRWPVLWTRFPFENGRGLPAPGASGGERIMSYVPHMTPKRILDKV